MNITKVLRLAIFAIPLLVMLLSCKKETEDPVINEDPEILKVNFESIAEFSKLKGEVNVKINVSDISSLSKVEFFIDNQLIKDFTQEEELKVSWNTTEYPDGPHAIKAIAHDNKGNKVEASLKVLVGNKLLTVNVPSQVIYSTPSLKRSIFIFVSDLEGNTLAIKEIENGKPFTIEFPDGFNGDKMIISEVRLNSFDYIDYIDSHSLIYSYPCSTSEVISYSAVVNPLGSTGFSNIALENLPDDYKNVSWGYSSNSSFGSGTLQNEAIKFWVSQKSVPSEILLFSKGTTPVYRMLSGIEKDGDYIFNFENFTPMKKHVFSTPSPKRITGSVYGYKTAGASDRFYLGNSETQNGNLDLYFPEGLFQEYHSYLRVFEDEGDYFYTKRGNLVTNFVKPAFNFEVKNADLSHIIFTTSGQYDFANVELYKANNNPDLGDVFMNIWIYHHPSGQEIDIKFPQIPEEFTQIHGTLTNQNFEVATISLVDDFELNTYQQHFDNNFKPDKINSTGSVRLRKNIDNPSGRFLPSNRQEDMIEKLRNKEF